MAIKRGDRLILRMGGQRVPVEAASDESGGTVQIKYKGAVTTASVFDLEPDGGGVVAVTGNVPDVTNAVESCPSCGGSGTFVPPSQADTTRRVVVVNFRCEDCQHKWIFEYPLK